VGAEFDSKELFAFFNHGMDVNAAINGVCISFFFFFQCK